MSAGAIRPAQRVRTFGVMSQRLDTTSSTPLTAARADAPTRGDERAPWLQWAIAVLTLGMYAVAVHYRTNRELRDFGVDVNPGVSLLAFFPGVLVVVPYLVSVHRTAERVGVAQETAGLVPSIRPTTCTVLSLVALLHVPYQQSELNRAWRADALEEEPS